MTDTPETIEQAIRRIDGELDTACPGECNRAWRKHQRRAVLELQAAVDQRRDPNPERIRPLTYAEAAPVWCRACTDQIVSGLGRLPELAAACGRRRDGQLAPAPPVERRATASAPPSPSPGWDQVDTIVAFAAEWADRLSRHLAEPDPARYDQNGLPGRTLTHSVWWLIGHRSPLMAAPFAREFGLELLTLVHRTEKVAGVDPLEHRIRTPCFMCGRRALTRRDGAARVVCGNCRRSWPEDQYDWLAHNATSTPQATAGG